MIRLRWPASPGAVGEPAARRIGLLYAATLGYFTVSAMFVVGIQLFLVERLGAAESTVGLAVGVYALSAVAFRPAMGRGIDARGRRPFLLGALALYGLTAVLFTAAASPASVLLLRLCQGVAGAAFYTSGAAMVTDFTPPQHRAKAIARFSLFLYGGLALGPVLAEQSARHFGFTATWSIAAALCLLAFTCAWQLPESLPDRGPGAPVRATLTGLRRLVHPAALGPGMALLMPSIGYAGVVGFSGLYATEINLPSSGLLYGTFAAVIILVRLFAGGVSDRYGHHRVGLPALGCATAGLGLLAWGPGPTIAVAGTALFGLGFALLFPALFALMVGRVPMHERAEALGSFSVFMDIGMGGGGYVIGYLIETSGFAAAFGTAALLCFAGGILLVFVAADGVAGDGA